MIGTNIEVQPHQSGHKVWPETYELSPNEKALLLVERNETRPDFSGLHRYQTIFVSRNDTLAKYMEDMGPAELFIAAELDIPGGDPGKPHSEWVETVASLKDYADDFRDWLTNRQARHEIPGLLNRYYDQVDEEARVLRHLSQFGPQYKVIRG